MKKYISLFLALIFVLSLGACGSGQEDDGKALETADTYIDIQNNGGSIDLTEDTAKTLLGVYTPQQLGLQKEIYEYTLKLSATKYNDTEACKVEALDEDSNNVTATFMIVGSDCLVYDKKQAKYISLSNSGKTDKPSASVAGDENIETTTINIPDDPEITFQYHKENNYLMQQRFSKYDIATLGLSKPIEEYVFIVNGKSGYALDGSFIYYVDVHEKNGDKAGVTLGFSEDAEFIYDSEVALYSKIETEQ